jgi:threo-3-hydroxy-L-aspartate ammonia-lyase
MTANTTALSVTYEDIVAAGKRLEGIARRTPVHTSSTVDERTGARVFFKCENFQRMGAFKFRGAYNALSRLTAAERTRGVLAFSSGNHAQAVALAGRLLGAPVTVVMPADAPSVKIAATRGYGAEVVLYDRSGGPTREEIGRRLAEERNLVLIPPFDHADVVAGQGTAAVELIEEAGPLDLLLVPCGGGGLLSGSALAARALAPACRVIGVEPAAADDATRSFHTRELQTVSNPDTIADGARTPSLGKITFPLVLQNVDDMVTVSEDAIVSTTLLLWSRLKLVVEPTGALAAAALLDHVVEARGKRVGVILSGGNVDFESVLARAAARPLAPPPAQG